MASLGTQSGLPGRFGADAIALRSLDAVRASAVLGHQSSKRVQTGEANINSKTWAYLINFFRHVSSGLAQLDSDPGVDSNSFSD